MRFNNKEKELKVGDIVRIKSENWYYTNKDNDSHVINLRPFFTEEMVENCGKRFVIGTVIDRGDKVIRYYLKNDPTGYYYRKEYFE